MAFSATVVSVYLPVRARALTGSTAVVGLVVAGEGLTALFVPLFAGAWSDRLRRRGVSRLRFVLAGAPFAAIGLLALGLVGSLIAMALLVAAFFAAYFFAYEPYRALYPDLVEDEIAGRAQGTQAIWRGLGTLSALAAGGAMLSVAGVLPFAAAAGLLLAASAALAVLLPRVAGPRLRWPPDRVPHALPPGTAAREVLSVIRRHRELRLFLVANCLWELSLGALKTFVVLYVTRGLGYTLASASLLVGGVAVLILVGAAASGRVGDRLGTARTMQWSLWVYGLVLLVPAFTRAPAFVAAAVPFIAIGGGLVMTLPYAILMPLMPPGQHGLLTGYYSLSRGLGVMLGPLLGGVAIQLLGGLFASTHGYAAMWLVTAGAALASIPAVRRLRRRLGDG